MNWQIMMLRWIDQYDYRVEGNVEGADEDGAEDDDDVMYGSEEDSHIEDGAEEELTAFQVRAHISMRPKIKFT